MARIARYWAVMENPPRRCAAFAIFLRLGLALAMTASACSSGNRSTTGSGGSSVSSGGTSGGPGGVKGGSGGATSSGGVSGSGGSTVSGGGGGASASGGTTGSGGTSASGGTTGPGGASASAGSMGPGGLAGGGGTTANGGRGGSAGGNGGSGGSAGAGGRAIPPTITLTSPVLTEGGTFPANITCADPGMGSPELDWTAGPPGTMSYAVTLTDLTDELIQWAIWDIPTPDGAPTMIMLPAHLDTLATLTTPMGAVQINRVNGRGYYGPCPNETHTYRFQVYAIPSASLTGTMNSTDAASASMHAVALATGTLTATSNAHH